MEGVWGVALRSGQSDTLADVKVLRIFGGNCNNMSIGVHPDIITAAALWWSDRLRTRAKQDNGDPGLVLAVALLLAEERPSADQVDKFEQALLELLKATPGVEVLSCDYGPEGLLAEAARHAGIAHHCPPFPMKTVMWISGRDVRVKYGYGTPVQTIYKLQATS